MALRRYSTTDARHSRTAERQSGALRNRRAQAARLAVEAVMPRGCQEVGCRLAGAPLDHVCCRHLYGNDRMLAARPAADSAVILAVGPHDRSAQDIYALLLAAVAAEVHSSGAEQPAAPRQAG